MENINFLKKLEAGVHRDISKQHLQPICSKVFSFHWRFMWATIKKYNISTNLIQVIKNLYNKATSAVLLNSSIGDWLQTTVGVR